MPLPDSTTPPRVLVIGSINMDLVARVPAIPRPGETLTGRSLDFIPGGKGANQAVAAARLGAQVSMAGRLGDDAFSATLREGLTAAGIDTTAVLSTPNTASGTAWISVADDGQNAITVIPGSNGAVTVEDVARWEAIIAASELLLLQLEIPVDAVAAAIRLARRHGVRTILDAAPVPVTPLPAECYDVDILTPNQVEAELLTGVPVDQLSSAMVASARLLDRGARQVVIKLGALGAWLTEGKSQGIHYPPFPITPVDTTAAGDAFTAALGVAWTAGLSPRQAVRYANAAGALATTRMGAQPSMPTRAELEAFLADAIA
jgi:ribokinase